MARKRVSISEEWLTAPPPWVPTVKQREAAEYLALGYSQNRTSKIVGCAQSSISEWWGIAGFRELVDQRSQAFLETQESMFAASARLAQLIFHRGLTGDTSGDDATAVELATRLLEKTVWPVKKEALLRDLDADRDSDEAEDAGLP